MLRCGIAANCVNQATTGFPLAAFQRDEYRQSNIKALL
jgi:hypothetical protein